MQSVIVVDDDPSMRGILSLWASTSGYKVRTAESAEEAIVALEDQPAAIAVCDVKLPGEDGVWLASTIRQRYPSTAIIMATSGREADVAVSSLSNDVVDYLLKPFDAPRLREALALGRDWHRASSGADELHAKLQDRLRTRRAAVAAEVAEAQDSPRDALHSLISMLQLHQRDGRGHATRVARLAVAMADELGMKDEMLLELERGALLHDIGKLDMPTSILGKPAPLNDQEWKVMRTHPQVGYELVMRLPGFETAAEIVLAHHEAFDGSGYPRGLRRDEIPTGARILSVADSYDSMTHPHTQRPPMTPSMAMSEIERCSGTQFDPEMAMVLGPVLAHAAERHVNA